MLLKNILKNVIKKVFGDYVFLILIDYYTNHERNNTDFQTRKTFYESFICRGDLCFDVGANIGNRTGVFLKIGAKVVAVEPQKSCYRFLKYKYGKKIDIVTKGLGESNCIKNFHIAHTNTLSSFSDEWINRVKISNRFKEEQWNKVVEIEMTTLDELIKKYGAPKFIKIDVEGYELNVLKGLTRAIDMISFEYAVPEQVDKTIKCIEQIEKNNPNIECNYSIGESMLFALENWDNVDDMKKRIVTHDFINTEFGDIYVRNVTNR
jgi:FkbM family methyltransferase